MSGKIDADTLGIADSQELVTTPYAPLPGVIPPNGSEEQKQAAQHTEQVARDLRAATTGKPTEGADEEPEGAEEGTEEAATETSIDKMLKDIDALLTKAETAGVTAATGVQGVDLEEEEEDDDEEEAASKAAATALALRRWRENSRNRLKKGRAPRKFVDSNLSPEAHQAIWSKLEKAKTRVQVDAAFKASPKAKPARPAFHHNADAIVAHYGPVIAAALGKLFSASALKAAYKAAETTKTSAKKGSAKPPELRAAVSADGNKHCSKCDAYALTPRGEGYCSSFSNTLVQGGQTCDKWMPERAKKAAEPDPAAAAAIKSLEAASSSPKALEAALKELYGDGFLQGGHDAAAAVKGSLIASLSDVALTTDAAYWDAWEPGYGEAAALAADGGLADMLANADITIQGMTDTSIERLGNAISDGLSQGLSYEATAKSLDEVTEDAARSNSIANTEYARAMTTASVETYKEAGVTEVNWLAESDACPECDALAAESPLPIDGDEPPQHTNCRCALSPIVNLDVPAEEATPEGGEE
jgi:SPP1 gp7 family putative phage head morphogenesis protein